jgi:hypothetical protein
MLTISDLGERSGLLTKEKLLRHFDSGHGGGLDFC